MEFWEFKIHNIKFLGEKINGKHYVSVDCYLILDENSFSYIHDEKFYKEIFEDFDVAYLLRKYFFFFLLSSTSMYM
jgi:hypothetical protein